MLINNNKTGRYRRAALAVWLLAGVGAAHAADGVPSLDEARRLLDAGQAAQSAALLENELMTYAGDADYDYLLGLALYKSGKSGEALFAFERVLMENPDNVDARLKAAQISVDRSDAAYASELLKPLTNQMLGSSQQQELDRIRAAMAASKKTLTVSGYVLGGFGWDDNVTAGPDAKLLDIPGLPLPPQPHTLTDLGPASRAKDMVGVAEAAVSLQQAVGDETWLTGDGSLHQSFDRIRKDVTDSNVNLNLGMLTRSGNEYFGAAWLGQRYLVSDATYRTTSGGRINWAHSFDDNSLLTAYYQQLTFTYVHPIDNATRRIVGVTHESKTTGGATALQYGVYGGREVAKDVTKPHFSFHLLGASLGGSMAFSEDFSLAVGAICELRQHDSPDRLYLQLITRRDSVFSLGIAGDYRLDEHWHFIPRYTYLRNASTTALYDYTRNTFMLQLKREFDNGKE